MNRKSNLRILWHSVSPHIRSGYGNVTRYLTTGIKQAGFNIICSAYYGVEPGGILQINNVPIVASKRGQFGSIDYKYYFKSTRRNLGILMTDFWAFGWFPGIRLSCSTSPLDHEDYPPELQQYIKSYDYLVSLCKWTQKELAKFGCKSEFIPHGVNLSIFKPMNKDKAREITGLPKDKFIFGTINANSDKEPRKNWYGMLDALKQFLDNNPDVKDILHVIHTNPLDPRGVNLQLAVKKRGLENICKLENPFMSNVGISEEELAILYNTFDMFLAPSYREGFGLTFYEAMACGVPCIAHDFSAMTEAIKGHGWLARTKVRVTTPINAISGIPDVDDIEKCISDSYFNNSKREKYSRKARKFVLGYSWKSAISKWIEFLESIDISIPSMRMVGKKQEKDQLWKKIQRK